nr:cysteine proteinases superfamily protein [Tanacetum cinerariifolium]
VKSRQSPSINKNFMIAAYPYTFLAIKYNGGLDLDEAYPHTKVNGVCKYSLDSAVINVLDVVNIIMGAEDKLKPATGGV